MVENKLRDFIRINAKKRVIGAAVLSMAGVLSMSPVNAFANSSETKDDKCICIEKCSESGLNPVCDVCMDDITLCEGEEKETITLSENIPVVKDEEPMGPLTPDGNLTLVDDYGSPEKSGKQFITMVTKNGNYFYLIIDRDDEGDETVHFLNMVDESDLLALMDDEEAAKYAPIVEETEEEEVIEEEPVEETKEEPKGSKASGIVALLAIVGIGGAGGYMYFKNQKDKKATENEVDPDADYREDEEPSFEQEDDYEVVDLEQMLDEDNE